MFNERRSRRFAYSGQAGILTESRHMKAKVRSVNTDRIKQELDQIELLLSPDSKVSQKTIMSQQLAVVDLTHLR